MEQGHGRGIEITHWPGPGGTPDEPDTTPPVPDDVWRKFLGDSEHAIRVSAPREPSAWERGQGCPHSDDARCATGADGMDTDRNRSEDGNEKDRDGTGGRNGDGTGGRGRWDRHGGDVTGGCEAHWRPLTPDRVDGVWGPDDPWAGPDWRELDGPARLRRAGRVIATAVAITLALGSWSYLSTGAGNPVDSGPRRTSVEQPGEGSEELPAARQVPPRPAGQARPSSSAAS